MSRLRDTIGETYKVIRGYLPREEAIELGENFKKRAEDNKFGNEAAGFVDNCVSEYNCPELAAVLSEKTSFLNEYLGEKVIPSYCYTRVSYTGSILPRHKDRESCEVSLSIHLYGDTPWAFGIVDSYGEDVEIILEPGDAILYDAPNATHFRSEYTGEYYVQSFHHYVYLNGQHKDLVFDKDRGECDLRHYIKHWRGRVPSEVCDRIVEYSTRSEHADRWNASTVTSYEEGVRVCTQIELNDKDPIDSEIYSYVTKAIGEYARDFPFCATTTDYGYTILKYVEGGKFDYHVDQSTEYNRVLTLIINLNDEYEGAELKFIRDNKIVRLGKGDLIMFPSSFVYPHTITPVTKGTRYSMVTWLA